MPDFGQWFSSVEDALNSIGMPASEWQRVWPYDFRRDFEGGVPAVVSAENANRYWWYQQNLAAGDECRKTPKCWLPNRHTGNCQPA